jgi:hypothetical protein
VLLNVNVFAPFTIFVAGMVTKSIKYDCPRPDE